MYSPSDLTIVIPTLGRQPALLDQILDCITPTASIVVVWDGHAPPDAEFINILHRHSSNARLVCHERNRGLSAARNTGARSTLTPLCMFVDDDIVPEAGFEVRVVAFHNQYRDVLQMMLGCVTWRNGPFANSLTEWYETRSNWSLFHTVQADQNFSFFAGGFTSFKTAALTDIHFDETFVRYGSEDTEFGYRFFRLGGALIYRPDIVGTHMKKLDFESYRRDHTGAGYSHGRMLDLHPDVGMDIDYIVRAINSTVRPEAIDQLCDVANEMLYNIPNPSTDEQCDLLLRLITNQCLQHGLVDYISAHYEGFSDARELALKGQPISREALLEAVIGYAPFKLAMAESASNPATRLRYIDEAVALNPRYAAPRLLAFDNALPDPVTAGLRLAHYLDAYGAALDQHTANKVRYRLENNTAEAPPSSTMSARDLYSRLTQFMANDTGTVIELAQAILERDISHVGARIAWARALEGNEPGVIKLLLAEARFFLRNRPLHEQKDRSAEIAKLMETYL
jgi:GT2 family glycosyltransferase